MGGQNTGGNMNLGLQFPWNWYGQDCNRIGQYMWFRKIGSPTNNICDGYSLSGTVGLTNENVFNVRMLAQLPASRHFSSAVRALMS
jgi:hypothetical protein